MNEKQIPQKTKERERERENLAPKCNSIRKIHITQRQNCKEYRQLVIASTITIIVLNGLALLTTSLGFNGGLIYRAVEEYVRQLVELLDILKLIERFLEESFT